MFDFRTETNGPGSRDRAPPATGADTDAALEALRLAYARGELTDEGFQPRRAVLADDRSDEA